jgi:hypothetical protein
MMSAEVNLISINSMEIFKEPELRQLSKELPFLLPKGEEDVGLDAPRFELRISI